MKSNISNFMVSVLAGLFLWFIAEYFKKKKSTQQKSDDVPPVETPGKQIGGTMDPPVFSPGESGTPLPEKQFVTAKDVGTGAIDDPDGIQPKTRPVEQDYSKELIEKQNAGGI